MSREDLTLIASVAAVAVSLVALWASVLRPFAPRVLHTPPRFTLYPLTSEEANIRIPDLKWWIPSFDLGVTVYNVGLRPGEIRDIQVILAPLDPADRGDLPTQSFAARYSVDLQRFSASHHRFEWMSTAILRNWYPALVVASEPLSLHVVLEGPNRWDQPIVGRFRASLSAHTSKAKDPMVLGDYILELTDDDYRIEGRHTLALLSSDEPAGGFWESTHHHPPAR
jgi:hypothetical protein